MKVSVRINNLSCKLKREGQIGSCTGKMLNPIHFRMCCMSCVNLAHPYASSLARVSALCYDSPCVIIMEKTGVLWRCPYAMKVLLYKSKELNKNAKQKRKQLQLDRIYEMYKWTTKIEAWTEYGKFTIARICLNRRIWEMYHRKNYSLNRMWEMLYYYYTFSHNNVSFR